MRDFKFVLAVWAILIPLGGFCQNHLNENDKRFFYGFLDSMNHPQFSFTHNQFIRAVELSKTIDHSKLQSHFTHFSYCFPQDRSQIYGFEYVSKIETNSVRKGKYQLALTVRNDSLLDIFYQYPPDPAAKVVDDEILKIFVHIVDADGNFYQIGEYGSAAFREGMRMPDHYQEVMKEYWVSNPGLYNPKKFDHFVFYNSEEYSGQFLIEMYVEKKSKKIKVFSTLQYMKEEEP
ncbi:MAG TPA: hypothetical protein PKH79_06385 [Prolixibacteraceae bacterium]|nr:hypothetical protein [Prolixibacteraceae bacterium]